MKTKALKTGIDHADKIKNGNKLIELFMGGYNVNYFFDDNHISTQGYDTSWDALMSVIQRIKEVVFDEGYDLFMPSHSSYISIGNACYDADLRQTWDSVVRWITLRYDLSEINKNLLPEKEVNGNICYRTSVRKGLVVTPNAIRKFRELINDKTPMHIICQSVTRKELYEQYKIHGDGKYAVSAEVGILIENYKVITILKPLFKLKNIYQKYGELER